MRRALALALALAPARALGAQAPEATSPVGHWTGAFLRAGGAQPVTAEVTGAGDSLRVSLAFADRPLGTRASAALRRDAQGRWTFGTPYGPAVVALDTAVRELVGTAGADSLGVRVHLKRLPPPGPHAVAREAVTVRSGRVALPGTLFLPRGAARAAAAILVQGRGCGPVGGMERQGELLAAHGLLVLVYDKRGADPATRPCATATIADLAEDVVAAAAFLAARGDVDPARVGAIGNSAGGWVIARASARAPLAFLAMTVGPSTSVEAQQLGSTRAIARLARFAPADSAAAERFVALTFARGDRERRFAEMRRLVEEGRRTGWVDQVLEADDIPASVAGLDSLWAVRNAYDPADDLRRFRGPVLALYGGDDPVVPADENVMRLHQLVPGERARAVVIPRANHGLEQRDELRSVPFGAASLAYWHARRGAPQVWDELVGFLRRTGMTAPAPR